jgi:hypothetical protein
LFLPELPLVYVFRLKKSFFFKNMSICSEAVNFILSNLLFRSLPLSVPLLVRSIMVLRPTPDTDIFLVTSTEYVIASNIFL